MIPEDDWIQLSSLQHYVFCPRQCALIHVNGLWAENRLTARGRVLHERVDSGEDETRGDTRVVRSLNIYSRVLGVSGKADVVEFKDDCGQTLPYPVEYKSGKPKYDDCDTVQLCAQALCLEEMLGIAIPEAALFYGKTRHRLRVELDSSLRDKTLEVIRTVHDMIKAREIPPARFQKKCQSCSLYDACMPGTGERSISNYIKRMYECHEATP